MQVRKSRPFPPAAFPCTSLRKRRNPASLRGFPATRPQPSWSNARPDRYTRPEGPRPPSPPGVSVDQLAWTAPAWVVAFFGRPMRTRPHSNAPTGPEDRAEIRAGSEPVAVLARHYGVSETTIRKGRARARHRGSQLRLPPPRLGYDAGGRGADRGAQDPRRVQPRRHHRGDAALRAPRPQPAARSGAFAPAASLQPLRHIEILPDPRAEGVAQPFRGEYRRENVTTKRQPTP